MKAIIIGFILGLLATYIKNLIDSSYKKRKNRKKIWRLYEWASAIKLRFFENFTFGSGDAGATELRLFNTQHHIWALREELISLKTYINSVEKDLFEDFDHNVISLFEQSKNAICDLVDSLDKEDFKKLKDGDSKERISFASTVNVKYFHLHSTVVFLMYRLTGKKHIEF